MGKFKKGGKKEVPQVSTSSLPDIVYMLIFFFMITTSMRDVELKVKTALPKATEIAKLEKKALLATKSNCGVPVTRLKELRSGSLSPEFNKIKPSVKHYVPSNFNDIFPPLFIDTI